MDPSLDPTDDQTSLLDSPRAWSILALVVSLAGGSTLAIQAGRIIQNVQRNGELSARYFDWSYALQRDPTEDPVKKPYVRELAGYYRHLGQVYKAKQQPWAKLAAINDPPDRPASLPGRIDPVTGTPPEVVEALRNLNGPIPITR